MARSHSKIAFALFALFFAMLFISGSMSTAQAQSFGDDWIEDEDEKLHILLTFDGRSATTATESNPIVIPRNEPMELHLEINVTNDVPLNVSGVITFYFNDIPVLPIQIQNPVTESAWVPVDPVLGIIPVTYLFNLSDYLEVGPVDLMTGIYQSRLSFSFYEIDPSDSVRSSVLHTVYTEFYFILPVENPLQVITTVAGLITTGSTIAAVGGVGLNIQKILEAIQTAHKAKSIHKKTGEIRSLPNLMVIGALPLLFSMLSSMVSVKKKKRKDAVEDQPDSVSEYRLRQRLRETAPEAWQVDKCPRCKRDWDKKTNTCKKCKIDVDTGRQEYAEYLSTKTEKAIKVVGKKKSISIQKLSKAIKTNEYNAGVIGAAMVDTGVTEIQKIDTPFRSFIINIGGLIFLILTWQQLLGGAASKFQTTLTFVGAGLSLAVIIALYVARKTQIEKLRVEVEDGGKLMPTEAEREAKDEIPEAESLPSEDEPYEEATDEETADEESDDYADEEVSELQEEIDEEWSEDSDLDDDSDSLPPERLDKERK
ncbi:MAG: hypothetical protein ACFFEF_03315 [Candidatus Thorarchaeota archaeon]